MDDLYYLPGHEALRLFRSRALSPVELMQAVIARTEAVNPAINAFTETYFDRAIDEARAAEARYAKGGDPNRPLDGLPLALKEEFRLAGTRRTSGSLIFKDRVDTDTDTMTQRLVNAGAIVHAKTTVPEFCLLGSTHSRQWGITRNPWNLEVTPGGSSGGSGAALAAGTTILATGTDIGGSIRIPAALCGIVGYKPPYGRNPEFPVFNLDFFSHSGPMTRSVADIALMQNVTSGPDPRDIASLRERVVLDTNAPKSLKGWKIAYSLDLGFHDIDDAVAQATLEALAVFRSLGATTTEVDLGWTIEMAEAAEAYLSHLWGAGMVELAAEHSDLMTDYVRWSVGVSGQSTPQDLLKSLRATVAMYDRFGPLMEEYDLFICPTLATSEVPADFAPPHGAVTVNGRTEVKHEMRWILTTPFNQLSRCPVLAVPSGFAPNGVPTGIQIVARTYDDARVMQAGLAYERARPWFTGGAARPKVTA